MKLLQPFQNLESNTRLLLALGWFLLVISFWLVYGLTGDTHLFPTLPQVITGFIGLWNEGLVVHIASSLFLCFKAIIISIFISLTLAYTSTTSIVKPVATFLSKFRYLPLTGISFYITMLINDARQIQIWILVVFMSTFLITSLLSMIAEISEAEFDHARTLGYNRWQVLWEVVVKGRIDYVIEIVRQNLAIVWMMLVTVESIMAAAGGLGFLIKNSDKFMNHGRIIALQIIILLVGLGLDYALTLIRKTLFRYSKL